MWRHAPPRGRGRPKQHKNPVSDVLTSQPAKLEDLVTGDLSDKPWQNEKYSSDSALWQGAALRRKMHQRRTKTALGTCSIDLSGPHEPTPRPGGNIAKDP